jgi:hypothetical protein
MASECFCQRNREGVTNQPLLGRGRFYKNEVVANPLKPGRFANGDRAKVSVMEESAASRIMEVGCDCPRKPVPVEARIRLGIIRLLT